MSQEEKQGKARNIALQANRSNYRSVMAQDRVVQPVRRETLNVTTKPILMRVQLSP